MTNSASLSLFSTNSAMSGGMSFKEALKVRLNIIKPSRDKVEELRQKYIDDIENILTPGIRSVMYNDNNYTSRIFMLYVIYHEGIYYDTIIL